LGQQDRKNIRHVIIPLCPPYHTHFDTYFDIDYNICRENATEFGKELLPVISSEETFETVQDIVKQTIYNNTKFWQTREGETREWECKIGGEEGDPATQEWLQYTTAIGKSGPRRRMTRTRTFRTRSSRRAPI